MAISNHSLSGSPNEAGVGDVKHIEDEYDFMPDFEKFFMQPLMSGSAYHVEIKSFMPLEETPIRKRYHESGLHVNIQKGYKNEYSIAFKPYVVEFEFRYEHNFIQNLKQMFYKAGSSHTSKVIFDIKDLRRFDMGCAVFGDFDLEYIEREGWYGIKKFYLDEVYGLKLEVAKDISKKLHRMQSNLYFSFLDSANQHVLGVYSDFHDYDLTMYNTKMARKVGRIMLNTTRSTFSTYQVEPLSPMAMSYKLRIFFLIRQNEIENLYSFIIFLNDNEIERIKNIKAWANADK